MCSSAYKVVSKKIDNIYVETYFLQDKSEKTMVEQREELGNIKSKSTS